MKQAKHCCTFFSLLILIGLLACSQHGPQENNKIHDGKIYSSRPQNKDGFIAIIKLKTPALLSQTEKQNGVTVLDPELQKNILEEQEAAIAKLQALSSDIKVIARYRLVLNGLAIVAPASLQDELRAMSGFSYIENEAQFARATVVPTAVGKSSKQLDQRNSVAFIGAHELHQRGIKGAGVSVGIIDTGIDYTHSMFGGPGTKDAYEAVDPNLPNAAYPNAKVVGGIDLVGTEYDSASPIFKYHIPKPDNNPLDEGEHGSHVAGTVAGLGDGINTYDGVAPEAKLHAIKVFGKDGSTGDAVVIAALEYAADPNSDFKLEDQLNIINLSLGSGYGRPHILYTEAVKNLVNAGTITVASAGNSGHSAYIVGAPSTVDEAISVAASVDDMEHNIHFRAVKFSSTNNPELLAEAIEGPVSKPIAQIESLSGKLVYLGTAAADLSEEQINAVKGHIAFIDRGQVTFQEKIERAFNAGALGVVVANSQDGEPISMGGDKEFAIPAIMITKGLAETLKTELKLGDVVIDFKTKEVIKRPELIDTLTSFSSQGPRSEDSNLKPDISAPGQNVISAKMGSGNEGLKMSGTSMAAPHVAGVMALLKQARPELNVQELKAIAMETAKPISEANKIYPVTMQGAGRVQVLQAAKAQLIVQPASLSLGNLPLGQHKLLRRQLTFSNHSDQSIDLTIPTVRKHNIAIAGQQFSVSANGQHSITVEIKLWPSDDKVSSEDMETYIEVASDAGVIARIPTLAVANKISQVSAQELKVYATDISDAAGSAADLKLSNKGVHGASVLAFNLLGSDKRKPQMSEVDLGRSFDCDLESVGYRVINKTVENQTELYFQVGVKLYNPITRWQPCEISVLLDANHDGIAEQELAGVLHGQLPGLPDDNNYSSLLLDAVKVRAIRRDYELSYARELANNEKLPKENYEKAIENVSEMIYFNHSTVAIIETPLNLLKVNTQGQLAIKVGILNEDRGAVEADDFLGPVEQWQTITPELAAQAYHTMPETIEVAAGKTVIVPLTKGEGTESLLLLYPNNPNTQLRTGSDQQSQVIRPTFY